MTTMVSPRSRPKKERKWSGWQVRAGYGNGPIMPAGPSKWEALLYRLGISEETLKTPQPLPAEIAEFARKHYESCYCPTWILERIGLNEFSRFDS